MLLCFFKWKAKYGGMDALALWRLKELEDENQRLKRVYEELSLDHQILKDIVE
jgi:putative transposase